MIDFQHEGSLAAVITLTRSCEIRGSRRTSSDQPGTQRYERIDDVESGYRGQRYYVYRGGCIEYGFNLRGTGSPQQVAAVSMSFGFVDRDLVRRYVDDYSGGRLHLDPTAARGAR